MGNTRNEIDDSSGLEGPGDGTGEEPIPTPEKTQFNLKSSSLPRLINAIPLGCEEDVSETFRYSHSFGAYSKEGNARQRFSSLSQSGPLVEAQREREGSPGKSLNGKAAKSKERTSEIKVRGNSRQGRSSVNGSFVHVMSVTSRALDRLSTAPQVQRSSISMGSGAASERLNSSSLSKQLALRQKSRSTMPLGNDKHTRAKGSSLAISIPSGPLSTMQSPWESKRRQGFSSSEEPSPCGMDLVVGSAPSDSVSMRARMRGRGEMLGGAGLTENTGLREPGVARLGLQDYVRSRAPSNSLASRGGRGSVVGRASVEGEGGKGDGGLSGVLSQGAVSPGPSSAPRSLRSPGSSRNSPSSEGTTAEPTSRGCSMCNKGDREEDEVRGRERICTCVPEEGEHAGLECWEETEGEQDGDDKELVLPLSPSSRGNTPFGSLIETSCLPSVFGSGWGRSRSNVTDGIEEGVEKHKEAPRRSSTTDSPGEASMQEAGSNPRSSDQGHTLRGGRRDHSAGLERASVGQRLQGKRFERLLSPLSSLFEPKLRFVKGLKERASVL